MIGNEAQDAFIKKNKWAVVTSLRKDGTPTSSVIFYALHGDELIFSTTKSRLKAKTIKNNPKVSVAVLDDGAPYGYVTIEGTATIQDTDVVPGHIAINTAMRGTPFTPPAGYAEGLIRDGRVLIHVRAERVHGVTGRS